MSWKIFKMTEDDCEDKKDKIDLLDTKGKNDEKMKKIKQKVC